MREAPNLWAWANRDEKRAVRDELVEGMELSPKVGRMCAMNLYLHNIGGDKVVVHAGHDSLAAPWSKEYTMILAKRRAPSRKALQKFLSSWQRVASYGKGFLAPQQKRCFFETTKLFPYGRSFQPRGRTKFRNPVANLAARFAPLFRSVPLRRFACCLKRQAREVNAHRAV